MNTRLMPLITKFASSTDVGHGEDSVVLLNEGEHGDTEEGVHGDREAAVACKSSRISQREAKERTCSERAVLDGRRTAIRGCIFMPNDEHRDFRAVLAFVPNLKRVEHTRRVPDIGIFLPAQH